MSFRIPRIYPITDPHLSGLSHAEQVAALAAGGATLIQLRDKNASSREFLQEAAKALELARSLGVQIVINDRVDIALSLAADGVHLGQTDLPPQAAREVLGRKALIGLSCHNLQQVTAATKQPVDYIALGPIFPTSSKTNPDPLVGLAGLEAARTSVSTPIVAIGGITQENANSVFRAGADSLALISSLLADAGAITQRLSEFLAINIHATPLE